MSLPGLLASCAHQDGDIQKFQLSVMCHTRICKVTHLWPNNFHTQKMRWKKTEGVRSMPPPPSPTVNGKYIMSNRIKSFHCIKEYSDNIISIIWRCISKINYFKNCIVSDLSLRNPNQFLWNKSLAYLKYNNLQQINFQNRIFSYL